jgi:hypothetical protein
MATSRAPGFPFVFRPLSEQDVQAIRTWRDLGPWGEYDPAPADPAVALDTPYGSYAIATPDGDLVGFCCFGPAARAPGGDYADERPLDLDFGVRPNLTGRAFETMFVRALLDFARRRFTAASYRATIPASHHRTMRLLGQWADFAVAGELTASQGGGTQTYTVLTLTDRGPGHVFGHD